MRKIRLRDLLLIVGIFLLMTTTPTANAASYSLGIPFGWYTGDVGSVHFVQEGPSPVSGVVCVPTLSVTNNASVHPGNDVRLYTNGEVSVFRDVERKAGAVTVGDAVSFGDVYRIEVTLGSHGQSSLEGNVDLECLPPTTTTTSTTSTTTPPSTTTTSTTEPPPTTTTTVPPTTTTVTTVPPSTTSTTTSTTITTPPSTTEPPTTNTEPPPTLPVTGTTTTTIGLAGLLLLLLGGLMIAVEYRERRTG